MPATFELVESLRFCENGERNLAAAAGVHGECDANQVTLRQTEDFERTI